MKASNRLIALDVFRGLTIAGMLVVNNPASWSHIYDPLKHAEWNGITPTDFVFPFFLFIVGISIVLAYSKKLAANADKSQMIKKIIWRSAKIYAVGIFLWLWPNFDFGGIRWVGVLHRIALVFLPCAIIFLYTDWKAQLKICIGLLVGYWIVMCYVPLPNGAMPDLSGPMNNWAHWLDERIIPGRLWQQTWDPEGLLSTLPSIATALTGMLIGRLLIANLAIFQKITWIFFFGFIMFWLGGIVNWFFPINKNIWSSSYVLYTSGLAAMLLAALILVIDHLKYDKWTLVGRVFGANSIAAYVLAGLLNVLFYSGTGLNQMFLDGMISMGTPSKLASLMYALMYVAVIFVPAYILYKKKIYIKL